MSVLRIARQLFLALVVILGLTLVPIGTANADSGVCDVSGGYVKPLNGANSGSVTDQPWGTVSWGGNNLNYTVNDGWKIGFCIKAGNDVVETVVTGPATGTFSTPGQQGISHIGYKVLLVPPVLPVAAPAAPVVTPPTCDNAGSYTLPADTTQIDWQISPAYTGPGSYTVKAVLKNKATTKWADTNNTTDKTWNITVLPKGSGLDCRTPITIPAAPTAGNPTCQNAGAFSLPADTNVIDWQISPAYSAGDSGSYVVSAVLKDTTTTKWTDGTTAPKTFNITIRPAGYNLDCRSTVAVPAAPTAVPPTCTTNGSFSLPADTSAIHWSIAPAYSGVGSYVVTAALKDTATTKWSDGTSTDKTFNVNVLSKGTGLICVTVPAAPEVAPPTCATNGSYSLPADTTAIDWAISPAYSGPGAYTVTATLKQAGAHWTDGTGAARTWDINVRPAGYGLACVAIPGTPSVNPPSCNTNGSFSLPADTDSIHWSTTYVNAPGTYTVTAALKEAGAHWTDDTTAAKTWNITVRQAGYGLTCVELPADQTAQAPTCAKDGSYSLPDDTTAIDWAITPAYTGPGSYTVTATLKQAGAKWMDNTTAAKSWDVTVLEKTTGLNCVAIPAQPQVVAPTCATDGSFTLPADTDAIDWATNYTGAPGSYTVTATLKEAGAHWSDDTTAAKSWGILVLGKGFGLTCVSVPAQPEVQAPTCATNGSFSLPADTEAIDWATTYDGEPGTYTVTATLKQAGAHWNDDTTAAKTFTITVLSKGTGLTCVAIPAQPGVQAPTCATNGSFTLPTDTAAIHWATTYDGKPGTYTVTAWLLQEGAHWMDDTQGPKIWDITVLAKGTGLTCVQIPAQPEVQAPTCATNGSFSLPADTEAIDWATTYDGKPGTYTVTATLKQAGAHWMDDTTAAKSWDITVLGSGSGLTCVEIPGQPQVAPPTCAIDGSFNLPADTEAIDWATTYDGEPGTYTVTAALKQAGAHWADDSSAAKSFEITVLGKGTGLNCVSIPAQPEVEAPTCATDGSFNLPADTEAIDWATTYDGEPGTYTVTAALKQEGAHWSDDSSAPKSWDITVLSKGTGLDCVAIPAQPEVQAPTCATDGSFALPASTEDVAWSIDPTYAGPGVYTVTASLVQEGAHWVDDSTASKSWEITVLGKASGQNCVNIPDAPVVEGPSCAGAGSYTLPESTDDVAWSIDPEYAGVGNYTVTASLVQDGAHWADDTTAPKSWEISVVDLTDEEYFEECAPVQPAALERVEPQLQQSCELGGVHTWEDVYTTPYVWDATTRTWVPGEETGPVATNDTFTAYTQQQLESKGCVEVEGEQGNHEHHGHQHPSNNPSPATPAVKGEQAIVPTVVEAGLATQPASPKQETPGRNPLWLMVIGAGLGMIVAGRRRRNSL